MEIIARPIDSSSDSHPLDPATIDLPPEVYFQLRSYVKEIASLYRRHSFHCFEHATHVTQSVAKLLARVVTSETSESDKGDPHGYNYGIASDPLMHFAIVFAALIHDVDHPGISNATLVKENTSIALQYKNKSVAEQNSVDVAWDLLSDPCYSKLWGCIFSNETELQHFRQVVVNTVMATDIMDKELGAARKIRWERAFQNPDNLSDSIQETTNRKATVVIEHLIQASDISHTMQHWHVYVKWNEYLFFEHYKCYQDGHVEKDPSEDWYQSELDYFDFYVIPLAKKLKECGVFGVASDEYLQYAQANRREWEAKGKDTLKGYIAKYEIEKQQRR